MPGYHYRPGICAGNCSNWCGLIAVTACSILVHVSFAAGESDTLFIFKDQWIGDTEQSKGPGNFGLWRWCSDR